VEDGRGNGFVIKIQVMNDFGNRQAVHKIGFARGTRLRVVGQSCPIQRSADIFPFGVTASVSNGGQPGIRVQRLPMYGRLGFCACYHAG
jgi:hypothetical protein